MNNTFTDDFFYPLYLAYMCDRKNFYKNFINEVKKAYAEYSEDGKFAFRYVPAKNGDHCVVADVVYKGKLILNHIGYGDENVALMSMVHGMRTNDFKTL